jgi:biopolymer transport protein TolR
MHDPNLDGELEETEKINVVPLADLTLVLLIVLMVLSPMITQSMIRVQAPRVEEQATEGFLAPPPGAEAPPSPLLVEMSEKGLRLNYVVFADAAALLRAIESQLQQAADRPVIVAATDGIKVGSIVEILDGAKLAGAKSVALVKNTAEAFKK